MEQKVKYYQKEPFQHGGYLIDTDVPDVSEFQRIVDTQILLANLDNSVIRFYQRDAQLLTEMFDMARRCPELVPFFKKIYYGWKAEVQMTRTKDGLERKMQANIGIGYVPKEALLGYGQLDQQVQEQEQNLFDKLMSSFKGKGKQQQQQSGQYG